MTEVPSASLGELRVSRSTRFDGSDQLFRLAKTAASALDAPFACICLPSPTDADERNCYGPGASEHVNFITSLADGLGAGGDAIVSRSGHAGGDGAAIRSFAALHVGAVSANPGLICVFDYADRTFSQTDIALLRQFAELAKVEMERRKEMESTREQLRMSLQRAEEISKLKSVFLTNISHETRTPLTTILGFAEILEEEVGDSQREFVHLIQQGGKRLLNTLMSIIDLARLESSSFRFEPKRFDVAAVILDACLLLKPLALEKGISLEICVPDEPVIAHLDTSAVERTVSNLVTNAIKFTSEGRVTVSLEADDTDVLIHVADTGVGISAEFMPYLFDEFKQESEGLSRVHEGSGLGLPITKRLVELMKGNIMADSEKGHGSVFTVALPRNGEKERSADNGQTRNERARPRVLVVEDNADTRTLVNHLLRKSYDVALAATGEEALDLAASSTFDVLLVDINLGKGKSGEDVLREVRKLGDYEETPIVAVTAYAMPGDKERFFAEGFDDYVSKPFSKQRLLEALEAVLE